ncbi:tRNA (adenine(22)-N(1))-methyltransferase [Paenibacillus senegalensis]|uniref:tRNA (adenine(22)-N(1))-methyltransferase n=1 Tax=Paenibacillus senegalensis TaxID=1465766 RepID=UPI00028A2C92|nr:tRNA (adenine(22)-N(1))-methyltransferase TrmK [Paenibacillus senegalensis]
MVNISKRLERISSYIPKGARLADIGSDHALLPVYTIQQGIAVSAIAGEVNAGPYQAAVKQVADAGLAKQIEVRLGDGLSVLHDGEADTVTIAGMGGSLISDILERGAHRLSSVKVMVLQPNVGEEAVRRWLHYNGWLLADETILEEDGKIYEILHCIRSERRDHAARVSSLYEPAVIHGMRVSGDLLFRLGPYLLRQANPIFRRKWQDELNKKEKIADQLAASRLPESLARREAFVKEIEELREVLQCLPKDKPSFN